MRIYALSASGGSGKTATLNTLARNLCAQVSKYSLGAGCSLPPVPPWASDGTYWFDTKRAGNAVRVGICTFGDTPSYIDKAFDYFARNRCDVCFLACHTWGVTVDEIERKAQAQGVVPQYLYLISSISGRSRPAVQHDVAVFLESLI